MGEKLGKVANYNCKISLCTLYRRSNIPTYLPTWCFLPTTAIHTIYHQQYKNIVHQYSKRGWSMESVGFLGIWNDGNYLLVPHIYNCFEPSQDDRPTSENTIAIIERSGRKNPTNAVNIWRPQTLRLVGNGIWIWSHSSVYFAMGNLL